MARNACDKPGTTKLRRDFSQRKQTPFYCAWGCFRVFLIDGSAEPGQASIRVRPSPLNRCSFWRIAANPGELPPGEVIVRIPGSEAPPIGAKIRVAAMRQKLHLFSADGRTRIEA